MPSAGQASRVGGGTRVHGALCQISALRWSAGGMDGAAARCDGYEALRLVDVRTLEAGKRVWRVVAERYGWETIIGTDTGGARRSWPFWCSTCWTKRRLLTDQSPSTCGGCGGTCWCFIDKQIRSRECGTGGNSCPRYKSSGTAAGAPYGGDPPHSRGY